MKIMVVAGTSGGHIYPALGFLDTLKNKPEIEPLLVMPKSGLKNLGTFECRTEYISISSIKPAFNFRNFFAALKFFKGSLESLFLLLKFKPDIVVGFGSIACVPMVVFASVFGIKTLIHEQNVIPGRANRFLAKFTNKIAVSFAETSDYFKDVKDKIIVTGTPMRRQLARIDKFKALRFFGFDDGKPTLLVIGGSQGSHRINIELLKAISMISDKSKLQIIHLSGVKDYDILMCGYKELNVKVGLFKFLATMQYAYSASDFVLSRAGATTIAEIIHFALPAIILPYPYAYKHQLMNAKILSDKGVAVVIQDNELSAEKLRKLIDSFMSDPDKLKIMRSYYNNFLKIEANSIFLDSVLSLN